MAETKYLYGAAVQGIQSFIFQTNELKDIVGASELVEQICTEDFKEFTENVDGEPVVNAAGNVKFIFDNREACEKAVRDFPQKVMEKAPGITISQAVVIYDDDDFEKAVNELERKLRIQRNRPMPSTTLGLMAIERNRKTGLPAVKVEKGEFLDKATVAKRSNCDEAKDRLCKKAFGIENIHDRKFAYDIEKITTKNDWIAIIHADGNGLGKIIHNIGGDKKKYHEFSEKLDKATTIAAQRAFKEIDSLYGITNEKRIPIRPVVLGGDDFTMICRADFAIDYTKEFLKAFEEETSKMGHPLTACAGIAFIKSSFPFHYGYKLAESLCDAAKKDAKSIKEENAPSCLMFHKVQDSFVTDFNEITERELTPCDGVSWKFGPYYLDELDNDELDNRWCIEDLTTLVNELDSDEGNAIKSSIRQWLSAMHKDTGYAEQLRKRALSVAPKNIKQTLEDATISRETTVNYKKINNYPAYDILSLFSVIYQETK